MQKKLEQLKYITQFFPLRFNFFVFVGLFILIYHFANQSIVETSSFRHFLVLMSKIAFGIFSLLLLFSLLSTIASCIYFIRHREYFHVQILNKTNDNKPSIEVYTFMKKILRPILGSVQVKYEYNEHNLSPSFILARENSFELFPTMSHRSSIELPNIKEYKLEGALLSFQDLFRFFSFTFRNSIESQFTNLPKEVNFASKQLEPQTTENEDIRTNKPRAINGEWLEYKKYEASDDIRRIVWKAFAKSRELLVRKQETQSPYASHINCYASFYSANQYSTLSANAMADYYKNLLWSLFQELATSELQVKLHTELIPQGSMARNVVSQRISQAEWQEEKTPSSFFDPQKASVYILHSLLSESEIDYIVSIAKKSSMIIYIDVTAAFKEVETHSWLYKLFFKPKNQIKEDIKTDWKNNFASKALGKQIDSHKRILANSLATVEWIE